MSEKKWQVSIYTIHQLTKKTQDVYEVLGDSNNSRIEKVKEIYKLLEVEGRYKYKLQDLENLRHGEFELFLFYRKHLKGVPPWKEFFENHVTANSAIKKIPKSYNESFVFFLYHTKKEKLYAISGGYGFFVIDKHIVGDFGIEILSRLVKDKGDKVLQYAREIGLTSGISGTSKIFRKEYNFHQNRNFGNVYKEILATADKDILRKLGLPVDEIKKCLVKDSFKINHSITYIGMINLVNKLDSIIDNEANIIVNDIKTIDSRRNSELVDSLNTYVLETIWGNRQNEEWLIGNIELQHENLEKYTFAYEYRCNRNIYNNSAILLMQLIEEFRVFEKGRFIKYLQRSQLRAFDSESQLLTHATIFNHIIYEFDYNEESYFLINGKYHQISNNFKDLLNESCKDFIIQNYDNGLDKPWGNIREGEYNLEYKGEDNTIVLDTIVPENIELCDILKYDEDNIYLYHVKKGFNGSMRDLTNQVFIAGNRILEDIKSDYSYLKSLYSKMENKDRYRGQIDSEEDFLEIFKQSRKLILVLAVKDDSTRDRELQNIESFSSNIAKFALNELVSNMRNLGLEFRITQIRSS